MIATAFSSSFAIADPIPTAPDQLIVNYDMSSALPAPPYPTISVLFSLDGWDPGEDLTISIYSGLNGTNFNSSQLFVVPVNPNFAISLQLPMDSNILDGTFSLGFSLAEGAADLSSACARGRTELGGATDRVCGTVAQVTEPSTAALALLALAVLGATTTRRRNPVSRA